MKVQPNVQTRNNGAEICSTALLLNRSIKLPHSPSAAMLLSWLATVSAMIVVIA